MVTKKTQAALELLRIGLAKRRRSDVNEASRQLLSLKPRLGIQWQSIATALAWNGETSLAIAAIEEMQSNLGFDETSAYVKANLLYRSGRLLEALEPIEDLVRAGRGPKTDIHRLSYQNFLGSIYLLLGRVKEARSAIDEAIALDPRSGQAWLSLSEIADFNGSDAGLVDQLEDAYAQGATIASEGMKLAHAAGRMRHQRGQYERAFEAFAQGAAFMISDPQVRAEREKFSVSALSLSFDAELIARIASKVNIPHDRVIFVTGLPRSGTTLVEQIIASHSMVTHGDELGFFRIIGHEVGGLDARSFETWLDRGGDPNDLVRLYLHLASERYGSEGRFIDKTVELGNFMGVILALFPKAPVFWMRREPIDNGWSAYRTAFARGASWSWDLDEIGRRLAQEDEMVAYWSKEAPGQIHFVDYQSLVRESPAHIPKIAEHAKLRFEVQMLTPHQTERTVTTASVTQVREPINLKGLGVADPYRRFLGPMIEAYEAAKPVN